MTAKRFIIMDNVPPGTHSNIWDKKKQHNQGIGDELWLGEVVAMLNEGVILAEENEQLKHQLQQQELEYATTCHRLAEENESLKEENKFLRNKVATYKSGNALLKSTLDKEWK